MYYCSLCLKDFVPTAGDVLRTGEDKCEACCFNSVGVCMTLVGMVMSAIKDVTPLALLDILGHS